MGKLNPKTIGTLGAGKHQDGDGLSLVVRASGSRAWELRYQKDGKRHQLGLGGFPAVSLKDARLAAAAERAKLRAGIDPKTARDTEREAKRLESAQAVTFSAVAAAYIEAHRPSWKSAKHGQQWANTLQTYAYPIIGQLPPAEVTTAHVLEVLQPIWTAKPETASRVRNRMELVLDAAKARGLRDGENPARWRGHLDKLLPKKAKISSRQNFPALPWPELPAFMAEVRQHDALSFQAIRLTILTACRTSEVLAATWAEIDREARTWTIPASRMKAGREHRVPLSDAALQVLDNLPRLAGNPYLFPGARPGRPLCGVSMLAALERMGRGDLTMHGFRSTFRDWAAERTNYPREVCEMALAHTVATGAEAAYWRGDIFEKRRALLADWAAFATSTPAENVIQADFRRA